jgi:hypothetical protein
MWLLKDVIACYVFLLTLSYCRGRSQHVQQRHHHKNRQHMHSNFLGDWRESLAEGRMSLNASLAAHNGTPNKRFNDLLTHLSKILKRRQEHVHFVLFGACDGQSDMAVKLFMRNRKHWLGLFVEPAPLNYEDMQALFTENKVRNHAYILNAAVAGECRTPQLLFSFPNYEQDPATKHYKHWRRRQVGFVVQTEKVLNKIDADPHFQLLNVSCVTALDAIKSWKLHLAQSQSRTRNPNLSHFRIHALKIDIEGMEGPVLQNLLQPGTGLPDEDLPLLLVFESKQLKHNTDHIESVKRLLKIRGYDFEDFTENSLDVFAILSKF